MQRINFRYRLHGVQYAFGVTAPYCEGHQLTALEAEALNNLRSENIREAARGKFNELTEGVEKGSVLAPAELEMLQAMVDEFDLEYQFGTNNSPKDRLGAIEREARIIARARSAEGTSEEEIELLAQSIDLLAEARERIEARAKIMATEMEDLLK